MSKQVIIACNAHHFLADTLQQKGYSILYSDKISYADLLSAIGQAEGVVVTTRIAIDKAMIDQARNLRWIGRLGSGMELIDVGYAATKGIECISTPEGNRNAVAEHSMGLLLGLTSKIVSSFEEIKDGKWLREENRGTELEGKTIGIIGFGNTGQAFAKLLSSFGVTILAYDKYKNDFGGGYIREANFEQVCRYSDVISMNVPLTDDTHHMASQKFFESLEQSPIYLSASRGKVTNTDALIAALKNKKISGAALDVLENEHLSTFNREEQNQINYLTVHPNVILTPHIAGYSQEASLKMGKVLLEKLGL